ncbi:hypothetical protein [Arthrobacter sp. HY1533]|uniref:hypothetical protein n=1 Tax=Arthrobacter sp. HY1533 TaxID=2970919 RepID=UPI0022B9EE23|nr:hypothetical protein [Arthrobacter sp. HY1533]
MLILDTNLLAPDIVAEYMSQHRQPFFVSSVSAQELLGMQRPGKDTGYSYALPVLDEHLLGARMGVPLNEMSRRFGDHASRSPVSKHADRQVAPRSLLGPESLELGHAAVSIAHERGFDGLFRAFATSGLRGKKLKRVLSKWELLRNDIVAVIPLDNEISAQAAVLADQFVMSGCHVKGTVRNTRNDMLVAATSQITGMSLASDDVQLMKFYNEHGWNVTTRSSGMVATPISQIVGPQKVLTRRSESRGYVNRPPKIRVPIDYGRTPSLR